MLDSSKTHLFILALAVWVGYYLGIAGLPLFDLDEGAFTSATRAMFERGDFITPYLNNEVRFDKPILIYWLQAGSVALFGMQEWALRLPSALASTFWVAMIYLFALRFFSARQAFFSALVAATALMATVVGKAAIADAVLMLFMTAAVFATFLFWVEGHRRYIYWAFITMGLGFLTKGPVAVVIPAAVSFLFFLSTARLNDWWRAVLDWRGILLFLVIALPWYVIAFMINGMELIDDFFIKNNFERFSDTMHGHSGGYHYYPLVTFIALLPFTGAIITALSRLKSVFRGALNRRADIDTSTALLRFAWIWFFFVLILFSFSGTKLPHYLNYGLVGLMLIVGYYLPQIKNRWLHVTPVLLFFLFMLALPTLLNVFIDEIKPQYVADLLAERDAYLGWGWYLPVIAFSLLGIYSLSKRSGSLPHMMVPLALAFSFVANGILLTAVANLQQGPIKNAGLVAKELPGDLVMVGMKTPSVGVYADKTLALRPPKPGDLVLIHHDRWQTGRDGIQGQVLFAQGGVLLLRVEQIDGSTEPK